uniref:Uncharacterized protein n=1 Tax=Rhizophora mucronata TaxID=61149 RepID=A0A2P2N4V1_RHIMU
MTCYIMTPTEHIPICRYMLSLQAHKT